MSTKFSKEILKNKFIYFLFLPFLSLIFTTPVSSPITKSAITTLVVSSLTISMRTFLVTTFVCLFLLMTQKIHKVYKELILQGTKLSTNRLVNMTK